MGEGVFVSKTKPTEFKIAPGMRILLEMDNPLAGEESLSSGSTNDALNKVSLGSFVEEVFNDGHLLIQMPMYKSYYFQLPRDREVTAFFFTETRMFATQLQYVELVRIDTFEYAKVKQVTELKPSQRRECFRLEVKLPTTVVRVPEDEEAELDIIDAMLLDMSDGGVLFATDGMFFSKDKLIVTVKIDSGEEKLDAEVIRVEPTHGVGQHKRRVSAKFNHTCRKQKERIYKYILDQQRKLLSQQMRD